MAKLSPHTVGVNRIIFAFSCLFGVLAAVLILSAGRSWAGQAYGLAFQVSAAEMFDDNVTHSSAGREDLVTLLSLGVGARHDGRLGLFTVDGDLRQRLYARNSNFNNVSGELNLEWQAEPTKYDRFSVGNRTLRAEEPTSFDDEFENRGGRFSFFRNRFNLNWTRDIAQALSVTGNYGNELYDVSRNDLRDSWLHTAGFLFDWTLGASTIARGGYDVAARSFDPGDSSTTQTVSAGARRYLTPRVYVDGMTGVSFISGFSGDATTRPNILLSLTHEVNERTRNTLSFKKSSSTTSSTQDIFTSWRITGEAHRDLTRRLGASGSMFYGQGSYSGLSIEDDLFGAEAGLGYQIRPDVTGRVSYRFVSVDSTGAARSYDKNAVLVSVDAQF